MSDMDVGVLLRGELMKKRKRDSASCVLGVGVSVCGEESGWVV